MNKQYQEYPKWKYKEGESPRCVQTHQEEAELGDTWYDKPDGTNHTFDPAEAANSATPPGYTAQEYPKWRYAREYPGGRIVNSEEEEDALPDDAEWYDKPDFTNHGQDSTDTSSLVSMGGTTQPDALSGPNYLAPVPEMKQGKAAQKSSSIASMDESKDDDDKDANNGVDKDEAENGVIEPVAGSQHNNYDQANGTNPGDAAPVGENPNGPTGKITQVETEKQTAEETKPKKKPAKKSADDLL